MSIRYLNRGFALPDYPALTFITLEDLFSCLTSHYIDNAFLGRLKRSLISACIIVYLSFLGFCQQCSFKFYYYLRETKILQQFNFTRNSETCSKLQNNLGYMRMKLFNFISPRFNDTSFVNKSRNSLIICWERKLIKL